ncbi:MAG: sulfotransferase [Steroidobacteraceae bacterium]
MSVKGPQLVSLLANSYSGATLLTLLLNDHSRIVSNGEAMFINERDQTHYECTCGEHLENCDFYRATAAHMRLPDDTGWDRQLFMRVPSFSSSALVQGLLGSARYVSAARDRLIECIPAYRAIRDRFLQAQLQFFANARGFAGAPIYLDGTKSLRRAQLLAADGRSDMKVLFLIRDGRGFCASYLKNTSPRPSLAQSAQRWLAHIVRVDRFANGFPCIPLLTVRYEDLCRSTEETIRTICRFLEIPYENLAGGTTAKAHILGNRMRRTFSGTIVEDVSWREKLDPRSQSRLRSIMKGQLERFGYLAGADRSRSGMAEWPGASTVRGID